MLAAFLADLWDDLHAPGVLSQIVVIAACVVLGWLLSRLLRRLFVTRDARPPMLQIGVESFARVLSPLLILILIVIAKQALVRWQHVDLLKIAIPLAASLAVIRFGLYILRRVFVRAGAAGNTLILFEKVFALCIWVVVALHITGFWPDLVNILEDTSLPFGRNKLSVAMILQAIVLVLVMLIAALWAGTALEERLMQMDAVHSSLRVVMARAGRAVLIFIALFLSLWMLGIDLTVLSVFGGALGVGLGLGLQKIASSYISGFVILLDRSLAIGDMIKVDVYYGKVTQINTRFTVLQGLDGIESVIPNEMLVSSPVQNYSLSNRILRLSCQVTIGYESNIDEVFPLLLRAIAKVPRVLQDPEPHVLLLKLGNDGLDLDIGFWIADPENGGGGVKSEVNQVVWRVLKENRISVPCPQRDVRIVGEGPSLIKQ